MVYSQILTGLHAVIDVVGLPGNLLVITTIFMESSFHRMRYILLASLAVSDCLLLILGNSLNIVSVAQEPDGCMVKQCVFFILLLQDISI